MTKHSIELKLEIIQSFLSDNISKKELAQKYQVARSDIQKWIAAYEQNGLDGLTTVNGTYSGDFKLAVIKYMHNTGSSARRTAAYFNISAHNAVCKWERIYLEKGAEALYIERRGHKNQMNKQEKDNKPKLNEKYEEDLIAEVQRLRMENEYLKKLNALVQDREKSEKKTK